MKYCNKCGFFISAAVAPWIFHKDRKAKDGLSGTCKSCKRETENRVTRSRRDARRYEKDKAKVLARQKVRNLMGTAADFSCAVVGCGQVAAEFHHVDYTAPLDVVPLCKKHHTAEHD